MCACFATPRRLTASAVDIALPLGAYPHKTCFFSVRAYVATRRSLTVSSQRVRRLPQALVAVCVQRFTLYGRYVSRSAQNATQTATAAFTVT